MVAATQTATDTSWTKLTIARREGNTSIDFFSLQSLTQLEQKCLGWTLFLEQGVILGAHDILHVYVSNRLQSNYETKEGKANDLPLLVIDFLTGLCIYIAGEPISTLPMTRLSDTPHRRSSSFTHYVIESHAPNEPNLQGCNSPPVSLSSVASCLAFACC